ncbi:uncharacterized protein IL334_007733 [Kwoniella shivajii]|uniref:Spp2/MOS2 G-patch domain-containing protein n=1 Tax=Kwoniella shivajii TaxID=564305 RepID=A0ABZ1D9G6_9TREE|nr:hypothetical protein IL334_007733 [Kwoniella shivajii]
MSQPISFTVRPPSSAPYRPSPLGNGGSFRNKVGPPSRRLFENGHESEDEDEDFHSSGRHSSRPRDEKIEGFGNGRVLGGEKPAGPLVIPALPNKDWRNAATASSSSRKAPSYRPETKDSKETVETHERTGDGPQRSGLRKLDNIDYNDGYSTVKIEHVEEAPTDISVKEEEEAPSVKKEPLTLEEQALQAILTGDVKTETEEERLQRELVISSNNLTEEEAFKRDIDELPEESTAEDYAAIPVSAFGEAMARGMGWNPSSKEGTKIHEPKLRPALLGLGATALEKPLSPSRNGSSSSSKKPKTTKRDSMKYNLGEILIKKEKEGSSSGVSTPNGSSRRTSPESDSKRRRDDDDIRESKRYETDEERARRKARERERDYETDEERARRKAKERERRERYDGDRDRNGSYDRRDRDDRDRRDDKDRRDRYDRDRDRRRDR